MIDTLIIWGFYKNINQNQRLVPSRVMDKSISASNISGDNLIYSPTYPHDQLKNRRKKNQMNKDNLRYVEPSQLLRFTEPGRICGLLYF